MGIKIRLKQLNEVLNASDGRNAFDTDNKQSATPPEQPATPVNPSTPDDTSVLKAAEETEKAEQNARDFLDSSTLFPIDENDKDYQLYSKFIERLNQK